VASLQENLCGLIQVILVKVGENLQKPQVDNLVQQIIVKMFQASSTVTEDGLIMLNGLATSCAQNLNF
jgi:hypothetical protein